MGMAFFTQKESKLDLKEFDNLIDETIALRMEIEEDDKKLSEKNKKLQSMSSKISEILEERGETKLIRSGYTISLVKRSYAKIIDKNKFYNYLIENGIYNDLAQVSSQTASSFYKEKYEEAKQNQDLDFEVPGMEISSSSTALSFRKSSKSL